MTQRNFDVAMRKGGIGEEIIRRHLELKGWIVYKPFTGGAHCFDMLSIKDKKTAIAIDVKAKARLTKWPATGIDERHFVEYSAFSTKHSMPFWIFFVDEFLGTIYGNTIEELEKPRLVEGKNYPWLMHERLRIWPLDAMKHLATISAVDIESLGKLNQRNHAYPQI